MKRWELFYTFVIVIETGSFTAAANRLKVSRSLVSKKISQLEKELETQLLFRTTRKINPTDAGTRFFNKCKRIFNDLEEVEQAALNFANMPQGQLRIICTDIMGEKYVSLLAAQFSSFYPELKTEVEVTNRPVDLVEEGYDLAIRYGTIKNLSLKARKVFDMPHIVSASPLYFKKHGKPKKIQELQDHNCLISTFEPCAIWHFKTGNKYVKFKPQGNWYSNNVSALITATLQGIGISRLPELYIREYLKSGDLISIFDEYRYDHFPIWLVYPKTKYVSPKVRMFIDFIIDNIEDVTGIAAV